MIWIVGNKGMLGRELESLLVTKRLEFISSDREISILDLSMMRDFSRDKDLRWIVNCAAYTDVDGAEDEEDRALELNGPGAANLARIAAEKGAALIHISTDYVFDGTKPEPYSETDGTSPINVYGRSKLAGEELIRKSGCKYFIVRTAWLYGNSGPSFVHTMLRLMKTKKEIAIVNDQVGSPTYTVDLSEAILAFIERDSHEWGTYHYSGEGRISRYEFASEIYRMAHEARLLSDECVVKPIPSAMYPTKARRPGFSLLDKSKIKKILGIEIPSWENSLHRFLEKDFTKWNDDSRTS